MQRNMNRRGERCVSSGWEKSSSFAKEQKKCINNIGEQIIVINIWKIDGKGYICFENQTSFDNDLCRLRVISHLQFRGIR